MELKKTVWPVGGVWEDPEWTVQHDKYIKADDVKYYHACPHSVDLDDGTRRYPRVIVVKNEAGCNSTGLCLDCVLDAYGPPRGA